MGRGKRQGSPSRGLLAAGYGELVESALRDLVAEARPFMNLAALVVAASRRLGVGEGVPGREGARARRAADTYAFNHLRHLAGDKESRASRSRYLSEADQERIRELVACCRWRFQELVEAAGTPEAEVVRVPELERLLRSSPVAARTGPRSRLGALAS